MKVLHSCSIPFSLPRSFSVQTCSAAATWSSFDESADKCVLAIWIFPLNSCQIFPFLAIRAWLFFQQMWQLTGSLWVAGYRRPLETILPVEGAIRNNCKPTALFLRCVWSKDRLKIGLAPLLSCKVDRVRLQKKKQFWLQIDKVWAQPTQHSWLGCTGGSLPSHLLFISLCFRLTNCEEKKKKRIFYLYAMVLIEKHRATIPLAGIYLLVVNGYESKDLCRADRWAPLYTRALVLAAAKVDSDNLGM